MAKNANEDRRRGLFAVSWGHALECIESGNIPEWLTLTYENVSGDANIDHIISAHDLPSEMRDSLLAIPLALDDCLSDTAPPKLALGSS
jgi:hypothetical protein